MASELYFYCDPDRNTECKKRSCHIRGKPWAQCKLTRHQEFARLNRDGFPMIYGLKFEGDVGNDGRADGADSPDRERAAE